MSLEDTVLGLIYKLGVLAHGFEEIHDFSLHQYFANRAIVARTCDNAASDIEATIHNAKIANVAASAADTASSAASAAAAVGLLCAPATFGFSLGATVLSMTLGAVSISTSIITTLVEKNRVKADEEKVKEAMQKFQDEDDIVTVFMTSISKDFSTLYDACKNNKFKKASEVVEKIKDVKDTLMKLNEVRKDASWIKRMSEKSAMLRFCEYIDTEVATVMRMKGDLASETQAAVFPAAAKVPFTGWVIYEAGSKSARMIATSAALASTATGLYDTFHKLDQLNDKSETAEKYREIANKYRKRTQTIEMMVVCTQVGLPGEDIIQRKEHRDLAKVQFDHNGKSETICIQLLHGTSPDHFMRSYIYTHSTITEHGSTHMSEWRLLIADHEHKEGFGDWFLKYNEDDETYTIHSCSNQEGPKVLYADLSNDKLKLDENSARVILKDSGTSFKLMQMGNNEFILMVTSPSNAFLYVDPEGQNSWNVCIHESKLSKWMFNRNA